MHITNLAHLVLTLGDSCVELLAQKNQKPCPGPSDSILRGDFPKYLWVASIKTADPLKTKVGLKYD
jgi:hypothetical protein